MCKQFVKITIASSSNNYWVLISLAPVIKDFSIWKRLVVGLRFYKSVANKHICDGVVGYCQSFKFYKYSTLNALIGPLPIIIFVVNNCVLRFSSFSQNYNFIYKDLTLNSCIGPFPYSFEYE